MSCRSPVGNTPHICRTFQPVAMTLGLGSGSPLFAQKAWTCTTHGIFWALRPDTSPDSHARITCVYCSATPAYIFIVPVCQRSERTANSDFYRPAQPESRRLATYPAIACWLDRLRNYRDVSFPTFLSICPCALPALALGARYQNRTGTYCLEGSRSSINLIRRNNARYYRVGQARQGRKGMDKQLFSLSLTMILSKISMNVKQISRFCKIILNDACFFSLLSSIFSSCVFYRL